MFYESVLTSFLRLSVRPIQAMFLRPDKLICCGTVSRVRNQAVQDVSMYVCMYVCMYVRAVLNRLATPSDFHIPLPSVVPFAHS